MIRPIARMNLIRSVLMVLPLMAIQVPSTSVAEHSDKGQFVGVANCASSNCHGGVTPRKSSSVLQNEYITWFKRDRHSQAWKTLLSSDSKRMAEQLGIPDASKDKSCLQCHSTLIPETSSAGDRFRAEDGVSCESCHGAAGEWIKTHTATGTTHRDNIDHGLKPIDQPAERAKLCLSCHQVNEQNFFSHKLYGAGHPRLSFELDTYATIQPAHWLNDADYRERKGEHPSLAIWIDGQLASAESLVELLKKISSPQGDLFPELSAFTCSSCHHDLSHKQFLTRNYHRRTGQPRLNLSALEMVGVTMQSVDNAAAERLLAQLHSLHSGTVTPAAIGELKTELVAMQAIRAAHPPEQSPQKVLKALLEFGATNTSLYYETAEQLAMGMASAHAQLSNNGKRPNELEKIFKVLQSYDDFNPELFATACAQYLKTLGTR